MQDLWADFAGEALSMVDADRGGGLRQRRLTEQAVLMALRAWLLQEYVIPYGTSLAATRIFKRGYWIDGLGNIGQAAPSTSVPSQNGSETAGKRGRQKERASISTLPAALQLASDAATQLAGLDRPFTLYGLALDEKRGRRGNSHNSTASASNSNGNGASAAATLPKGGGALTGNWPELAPALLAALEQSAAIFLLNPLKDSLFRYTDLAPLYQRTAPTELFLWLSHKQIETRLLPTLRTSPGAAALTNLLRGDRWKGVLAREERPEHPERQVHKLVELLAESMRPHFLSVQLLAFPVCSGPALVAAAPYSLIFATRRQDSLYCLNDAVFQRANQLLAESQQGVLNEEWFSQRRAERAAQRRAKLVQEMLMLGRAHRVRRWPDLRQQLLLTHFGQHTQRDYDQIIAELLERGEVRCEWRKHNPQATEPAIPGNEDLLLWN